MNRDQQKKKQKEKEKNKRKMEMKKVIWRGRALIKHSWLSMWSMWLIEFFCGRECPRFLSP